SAFSESVTSSLKKSPFISSAVLLPASSSMSQTITFAPALVNVCAIPLPIPFAPPVTIAMLFFKSNILNISFNDYCQNQILFIYYLNTLSLKNYSDLKDTGQEWKIVVSTVIIVKKPAAH